MLFKFCFISILFLIYAFIGYIIEVLAILVEEKKLSLSRGFLVGPYLPIFGFGALVILFPLAKYQNDIFALYIFSVVLCGVLEYFTSYLMEKQYGFRWWDYSNKKHNINGRVCLENLLLFGIVSVLLVQFVNPLLVENINKMSSNIIIALGLIIVAIIVGDYIISIKTAYKVKNNLVVQKNKDNTSEIKKEAKKILNREPFLVHRLFISFPDVKENMKYKREKLRQYMKKESK